MKKGKILWMAVIAAMVLVPTLSWGKAPAAPVTTTKDLEPSFMIEIYAGGGTATSATRLFNDFDVLQGRAQGLIQTSIRGSINPYVIGGIKFGYWFNPNGTFGISSLPDWMKHVGFYTDFSYHKMNYGNSTSTFRTPRTWGNLLGSGGELDFETSGSLATWAFMFAGRFGFLPDSVVPFGRLQPYVAAGPAIFFSYQDPSFNLNSGLRWPFTARQLGIGFSPSGQSSINVGLAVEGGLRYFVKKAISFEASFKYRYFVPKYTYTGVTHVGAFAVPYDVSAKPNYHLYSGQIGVAYHF